MSLGSTYNNNQQQKSGPEVTVYSGYRMNNAESKIDATCMTFRFWKSNLCIGIFPRKNTGNDEVAFDMDNGITIYLSHTKARILKHEIEGFLENPLANKSVGVPSGQALITISDGTEYGKETPMLTIRKIGENGEILASFAYEFKRDYYFSVRNYNEKDGKYESVFGDYQNIELEQFITVLDEYIKASTNAVAFTVMDQRKYSNARTENKLDAIAAALGVDTAKSSNNGGRKYSGTSYFNNNNSSQSSSSSVGYESASIDDLE